MDNNTHDNKEINLLDLLGNIYIFIRKYYLFILISVLLGSSLGFIKEYTTTTYTLKSSINSNFVLQQIAPSLLRDIKVNFINKKYLSLILKLSPQECNEFKNLTFKTVSILDQQIIKIEIISSNKENAFKCMKAIKGYLINYPLYKDQVALYKLQRNFLLDKINEKLLSLDSLQKTIIVTIQQPTRQSIINNSYYLEYITLIERKQQIEKEQFVLESKFSVDKEDIIFLNKNNNITVILKFSLIFLFISILLALFYDIIIRIKKHVATKIEE